MRAGPLYRFKVLKSRIAMPKLKNLTNAKLWCGPGSKLKDLTNCQTVQKNFLYLCKMPIDFCCKMWYNRSRKTGRRRVRGECRLWLAYANSANIRSLNVLTNSSPANICSLSICELRQSVSCGELRTVASCELEVKG